MRCFTLPVKCAGVKCGIPPSKGGKRLKFFCRLHQRHLFVVIIKIYFNRFSYFLEHLLKINLNNYNKKVEKLLFPLLPNING